MQCHSFLLPRVEHLARKRDDRPRSVPRTRAVDRMAVRILPMCIIPPRRDVHAAESHRPNSRVGRAYDLHVVISRVYPGRTALLLDLEEALAAAPREDVGGLDKGIVPRRGDVRCWAEAPGRLDQEVRC